MPTTKCAQRASRFSHSTMYASIVLYDSRRQLRAAQQVHVLVVRRDDADAAPRRPGPQELRRDRDRDLGRTLAPDAGNADRAGEPREQRRRHAALAHQVLETLALGYRADQSRVREVAALEDRRADLVIERMAVCHDEAVAAGGQRRDLTHRVACLDHRDVPGRAVGEHATAAVDPANLAIESGHDG